MPLLLSAVTLKITGLQTNTDFILNRKHTNYLCRQSVFALIFCYSLRVKVLPENIYRFMLDDDYSSFHVIQYKIGIFCFCNHICRNEFIMQNKWSGVYLQIHTSRELLSLNDRQRNL